MPNDGRAPEIEVATREVEADGALWTVRVEGRAGIGVPGSTTPVLELVFSAEAQGAREALAVGRTLASLTEDQLLEALRTSRPHDPERRRGGFFEGTRQDRRRSRD